MEKKRPKPEDLLTQAHEEERLQEKEQKGKLKIFFGAAPGVGKTYAMLHEALSKRTEGLDIVIGLVETHGRKETEALLQGMEVLSRCTIEYRGKILNEFDLDTAIKRHPAVIVVDEMAHTNAIGMRHAKRWQDIKELLDRGIDVFTTLNVQHIESLNDVIKHITGVAVRETVPDSIIDLADSFELIDLPPEDLLDRLEEGKVYIPEQAELALQHFFRKSNLTALRELSLRFTAQRVNVQIQIQKRSSPEEKTWSTAERLLVCVDHKPFSVKLIRTTRRLATSFQADWIAVHVDTPKFHLSKEERQNAIQNLRFAEQLGAKTQILSGYDIVKEIMDYARPNNVTKIIIGKEVRSRLREALFKNLANELMRASHEIDVYIITGEKDEFKQKNANMTKTTKNAIPWFEYAMSIVSVVVCTVINFGLETFYGPNNLITIYLLGIVAVAAMGRRGPPVLASILSVFAYDFFFVPSRLGFGVMDTQYLVTLFVMLLVSQIVSQLTFYVKKQNEMIRENERRTSTLHRLSMELASTRGSDNLLKVGILHIAEVFASDVIGFIPERSGYLVEHIGSRELRELDAKERSIAQWAYDLGQKTGLGTDTLPFSNALYLPLQGASGKIGVVRIQPENPEILNIPEQMHLLETFIQQMVLAMEVDKLQDEAKKDEIKMQAEGMRNMLLGMTSYEIQIPLQAIQKSLDKLIQGIEQHDILDIKSYIKTIHKDSDQLNQISRALIQALRLEAGTVKLTKEKNSLEEIIHSALGKLVHKMHTKFINIVVPTDLPKVSCDFALIEQVFINLLENMMSLSTANTPLIVTALLKEDMVEVCIGDGDKGVSIKDIEIIFQNNPSRLKPPKISGSGLGLFNSKRIIHLHGGKIWIDGTEKVCTRFKFLLPIDSNS